MRTVFLILLINFTSNAWADNVVTGSGGSKLEGKVVSEFNKPWAMSFINKDNLLITTKAGKLWLVNRSGEQSLVSGVPKVFAGGQGGLGDVVVHPNYTKNKLIYVSYIDSDNRGKTRYATIIRGTLERTDKPQLKNIETIWKQTPARSGKGHFS
ncbi:MAG: PQQ-dependent sugar dehydrogenase, partial [Rhodospirillaceae bacterium]|nr:PQQ-dependent sugar dehydrogenase [Rhodospirillaceae bacterium]